MSINGARKSSRDEVGVLPPALFTNRWIEQEFGDLEEEKSRKRG